MMMVARHFRRRLLILSVSTLGFFISSFSVVLASDFTGSVVSVLDGDTIEVLNSQHSERIRLSGIDCPEKGQAHGKRAKQAASELVYGKEVTLQKHGKDKYGRTLADVRLFDGTNANHTLVKEGWCWSKSVQRQTNLSALKGSIETGAWPRSSEAWGKLCVGKATTPFIVWFISVCKTGLK